MDKSTLLVSVFPSIGRTWTTGANGHKSSCFILRVPLLIWRLHPRRQGFLIPAKPQDPPAPPPSIMQRQWFREQASYNLRSPSQPQYFICGLSKYCTKANHWSFEFIKKRKNYPVVRTSENYSVGSCTWVRSRALSLPIVKLHREEGNRSNLALLCIERTQ